MKEYILKGESAEVEKVLRENRLRVERGVISITPVQPETALDSDCIQTLIESHRASEEACQRMAESQMELADIASDLVAIIVTSGQTIPDEMISKLDSFGVFVPENADPVPESTDTGSEQSEKVPEPENPAAMDDKNNDIDDVKEVDLDADVKTPAVDDAKDVAEADVKESAPKKSTKRKKTE